MAGTSDPDGPSVYSTRQCSDVRWYQDLPSEREKVDAWIDEGDRRALGLVAIGSLAAFITIVLWLMDWRRSKKADPTSL